MKKRDRVEFADIRSCPSHFFKASCILYAVSRIDHSGRIDTAPSSSRRRILDAALHIITERGEANVTMAEIAKAAGVSRQAVYLHFADRAALLMELVRYADERIGLSAALKRVNETANAVGALEELAALQAKMNPGIWAAARAFEAVRRADEALERAWHDRLQSRVEMCRGIVAGLQRERALRDGLPPEEATDLLCTMTSLAVWEDLVVRQGWTAGQYEKRLEELLKRVLTDLNP